VEEVAAPFGPEVWPLFETIWYAMALFPLPPEREADLLPLTRLMRQRGAEISAGTLMAVLSELQVQVRQAMRVTAGYDLLLCPTLASPQARIGWFSETGDPAVDFDRQRRFSPYCAVFNVTGQPSVSLPVATTPGGLPVGALLTGRYGEDARLVAVAAQVEQIIAWSDRHPDIWRATPSATVNGV
jgi:amidase